MADNEHDQAVAWLAGRLHDVLCGDTGPHATDQTARIAHAVHDRDARDILDGCEVREEWGVRYGDNADFWTGAGGEQLARKAVNYATSAGRVATLIRRYVITTPATEHQ